MWSKSDERPIYLNSNANSIYLLPNPFYQIILTRLLGQDLLEADLLKNADQKDCKYLLDLGAYYFQRGDYQKAMLFYSKTAGLSDLEGMRRLGCLYFLGRGVEKDYEAAVKWLMKAANNDHAPAQFNIGLLYECGRGVPCDIQMAQMWYERSASQGCSCAYRAIERLNPAKNSLDSYEIANLVYLNDQLLDLKELVDLLSIKYVYHEKIILELEEDVERLEDEIFYLKFYSETDETESDY